MEYGQTYIDGQGYERIATPPEPSTITLTPKIIREIIYDMGWELMDADSFINEAIQRGVAT